MSHPEKGRESRVVPPSCGSRPNRLVAAPHLPSPSGAPGTALLGGGEAGRALLVAVFIATATVASADSIAVLAVSSRVGFGQACAIAPDLVLTAAHVVDPHEDNPAAPLVRLRFSAEDGTVGTLTPIAVDNASDVALLRPSVPLKHYHHLAAAAPWPGDTLHWFGYDWNRRRDIAKREKHEGKVLRVVAGHIWLEQESPPGVSGSCAENDRDEIVGIIWLGHRTFDEREAIVAVALFGPWRDEVDRLLAKAVEAAKN